MFYGEYLHTIDRKGRLILPAKFRESAKNNFIDRFFITRGLDGCLFMFSEEEWHNQEQRFKIQAEMREKGDEEAQMYDKEFVEALKYGMPPTTGFGVSERFFSFLVDKPIRECVLFPFMKPEK